MKQAPATRLLYSQDDFPVFQNRMYNTAEDARNCPRGDIRIVEDLKSGLVRNDTFDPSLVDYDSAYQNEQANSAPFRQHLDWAADLISDKIGLDDLVEVGCGKGTFLEILAGRGASITGFDPTYEGNSPRIQKRYFGPELGFSAKGLVLRHVLEHIPDPYAFLCQLRDANGGRGLIYIEVPCFDWICGKRSWFDIFYEHVNYFRLSDFCKIFGKAPAMGHCFGGQYLYVIGDLSSLREPEYDPQDPVMFPDGFIASLQDRASASTKSDVVWGGASKGVIYALLRERAGASVEAVIDINPSKQGRFLAGTGLRVSAPEEVLPNLPRSSRILVMNPNYCEEIRTMSNDAFTYVEVGND
ncbi:methyltransferase family protein [Litoreibacter halocynthiae]|uniref:Methyltransferase family protein n=1 Tax=Litoreibacter halocynthiae TaxID=1242689 RepID=A0A4R7LIC2_9RHOB|nr:class I SAM-dependent methyltransferase [Litoreibacter halocynthiae]TDT74111.1 methyltransferase family protein [Litoreibacter halocynthiae]